MNHYHKDLSLMPCLWYCFAWYFVLNSVMYEQIINLKSVIYECKDVSAE